MRDFSKLALSTLLLVFLFGTVAATETKAQTILSQILKRMESHADALSSVRSKITMSKHDSVLDDYEVVKGTVNYLPGKGRDVFVRVDWKDPYQEILVIGNGQYVLYRPKIKQAIVGKTSDADKNTRSSGALAFMNMSKSQLTLHYRTQYLGIEKVRGKDMWRLKLSPKKKTSYKYTELWVDGNGMPIQSKIVEQNDDSTTILLERVEKNITIKGSIFKLNLPKETKVIKS
jgi:outer membrane lipoprotein-sorting protein